MRRRALLVALPPAATALAGCLAESGATVTSLTLANRTDDRTLVSVTVEDADTIHHDDSHVVPPDGRQVARDWPCAAGTYTVTVGGTDGAASATFADGGPLAVEATIGVDGPEGIEGRGVDDGCG